MRAPLFWQEPSILSDLLKPFAWLYQRLMRWRWKHSTAERVNVPVICVGNLVMGGAGKTPVATAIARYLMQKGRHPHILSRGYGGKLSGIIPIRVNPDIHTAAQVGDEPLMLASQFPVWIGSNRMASAQAAIAAGADCLVMDDGFQNHSLRKDLSLLVIDGVYGFGNGRIFPAGPLRESPDDAFARADAVILINDDRQDIYARLPDGLARLQAEIRPVTPANHADAWVAFAGIGRPEKFLATLKAAGWNIVELIGFPDHHRFSARDIERLRRHKERHKAKLITTRKDWMRLPESFRSEVEVLDIEAAFENKAALKRLLEPVCGG